MPGINQDLARNWSRNREEVSYNGRWTIVGGAGAPTTKVGGVGMTLARTALGLYTLTLEATPAAIVGIDARLVSNTGNISVLTLTPTGATFRVGLYATPGTAADPIAGEIIIVNAIAVRSLTK